MKIYSIPTEQAPVSLLFLADPSKERIASYLPDSTCYVVEDGGDIWGACVVSHIDDGVYELHSIAVEPDKRGKGIGFKLLKHVIADVRHRGGRQIQVGTGTFGYPLTFYQRAGFRVHSIARDYYLHTYEMPLWESGVQHKDMLRFSLEL